MDRSQAGSSLPLPPPLLISERSQLPELARAISEAHRLALDTESNSLYAYTERVCLIQLSTDQADFLIDPLNFTSEDLGFLNRACADPAVEKVFHAAEYDIMVLRRDLAFQFANIFDTMIAARILGWTNFGLAALLTDHFGVKMNKTHQRANWGQRPLSPPLIAYAQLDVHYLLPLRDLLSTILDGQGCVEEARELFDEVCQSRWKGGGFDPDGFWSINGVRSLTPAGVGILKELYHFREQQARRSDLPVFKVLSDATLISISAAHPRTRDELTQLRALTDNQLRRYSSDIVSAVHRAMKTRPPQPARRPNGIDEETTRRFDALHNWRKTTAARRGVSSDIILSKDALWELAVTAPSTTEQLEQMRFIGPWRRHAYGIEILKTLASVDHAD